MTLTSPIWLFAASAILVPIAIHLWNRRQGKTVKIGSLRWLEPSASRRWSSIKLSDVWLLVLRCCIFILLAVALAKPVWEGPAKARQSRKVVLISPELLYSTALSGIKPTVDNLLQRGYTLLRYTPDFESIPAEEWQTLSSNPTDSVVSSGNHWGLLPALSQRYDQAEDSVWLFTSEQQRHFTGTPTPLQENIRWVPVALESTSNWIQAAYTLSADSLLVITGQSSRDGTRYSQTRVAGRNQTIVVNGSQVQLIVQGDSLVVERNGDISQQIPIIKHPLQIGIAHDQAQKGEVRYLQAALQAISRYTGIPIETRQIPANTQPDTTATWLFWLSSDEVPNTWLKQVRENGANLWVQSGAEPTANTAQLASSGIANIRIHQLSETGTEQASAKTIWQTTDGEPLLFMQRLGLGKVYHFRSAFGPAWSQLGQSAQLPELLLPLLLPQQVASRYDARAMDESQLKPTTKSLIIQDRQARQQYSLIPWLVLLVFLLFLAERLITSKRKAA
ncbi:MAG: BatA domain-containing protein [Hymenobacteraceae bacterium]|nr:BatA domain-containing protein [Hymenobacteraceae bacterium]